MLSHLIQRLDSVELLTDEAKARLQKLSLSIESFGPHEQIIGAYERRGDVHVVVEGVAVRQKSLGDSQAILGLLLPGDIDEPDTFVNALDHGVVALTPCKIAKIRRLPFEQLLRDWPTLARAFRRIARTDEAIRRVWLANMSQQTADRQAAHLLCELRARFEAVGMAGPDWFNNPFTQEHLANVLGISAVHMNRVIQRLRDLGLISYEGHGHVIRFPSLHRTRQFADFDDSYLWDTAFAEAALDQSKHQVHRMV
jgi:CRP-like cAMP-binding protein